MRFSPALAVTLVGGAATVVGCSRGNAGASSSAQPSASAPSAAPRPSAAPNALPMPSASVDAVVNPENLPPYDGPTGSVEGTVFVKGPDSPDVPGLDFHACPAALDTYRKLFRAGPPREDGRRPLADAVVVVTGYSGYYVPEKAASQTVVVSAACAYPRAIALTFGQRLDVLNDSKLSFAPYLQGSGDVTVMIAPPERHGEAVKIYPTKAAYFGLRDRLETFVHGDVLVLRHPLHAVTDLQGHFRIDGVPVGKLSVGAKLVPIQAEATKDVTVRASVVESVDLVLTYAPKPPAPAASNAKRPEIW